MIEVQFEPRDIVGLDLAMKRLDAKVLLQGEWNPFMVRFIELVGKYPPDFAGNTYKRTGHLGRSWTKQVVDPLTARIGNDAIYAGWVQGHEQMAYHAGHGWQDAFERAKDLIWHLIEKIGDKAERIWAQS